MPPGIGTLLSLAAPAIGGALFGQKQQQPQQPKETQIQKTQGKLINELLQSVSGQGQYSDLFQSSPEAFQKSYIDPALSTFRNQIAPQIQQSYIASGQQRGTGLEDTLARAGVDMNSQLASQYGNFVSGAQNRQASALSSILGAGPGYQEMPQQQQQNPWAQAIGGTLSNPQAQGAFERIFNQLLGSSSNQQLNKPFAGAFGQGGQQSYRQGFSNQ
jgi:hypothetical protein